MWPQVVQFETRNLQMDRERQLTREIAAAQARHRAAPRPRRARRLRLPTLPRRVDWSIGTARSRS